MHLQDRGGCIVPCADLLNCNRAYNRSHDQTLRINATSLVSVCFALIGYACRLLVWKAAVTTTKRLHPELSEVCKALNGHIAGHFSDVLLPSIDRSHLHVHVHASIYLHDLLIGLYICLYMYTAYI